MWRNSRTSKALIIVVCFLVVGIAGCGNGTGSQGGDAATVAQSHSYSTLSTSLGTTHTLSMIKTNGASFQVTSIDMSVTPTTVSLWKCGSYIQAVYNAVFHVDSGPNGGTIVFSYTLNNGRSQTFEKLTIIPGQHLSNFMFTWQGSLPSDHTYPGPGGVLITSPNYLLSKMVFPAGKCS
jgi:hypothetical protein